MCLCICVNDGLIYTLVSLKLHGRSAIKQNLGKHEKNTLTIYDHAHALQGKFATLAH